MFLICRKRGNSTDGPVNVVCQGDCEEFVLHYVKYNIGPESIDNFVIFEAKEVDIKKYLATPLAQIPPK